MAATARVGVVILFIGLCASGAAAQDGQAEPKWQVEVHSAGLFPGNPSKGTPITQFPPGTPIPTGQATTTSRAVSTWYFGDGTSLLNQVNGTLGVPARLTALDPILKEPVAHRRTAMALGVRAARMLTPRLVAEVNVDYAVGALGLTEETRRGLEAARSTFISAWNGLLLTGATSNRNITSVSDFDDGDAPLLSLTGALKIRLMPGQRVVPYATVGAGTIFHLGTTPSATLTGDYGFLFGGTVPMHERDAVTIRVEDVDRVFVGLVGVGFEYHANRRHGVRADLRFHMSPNRTDTVVTTAPVVSTQSPAFVVATPFNPSVQFSNDPRFNRPSSLSGPAIADLRTFTASGVRTDTHFALGYFVRF
jgi:hypothetical protein